MPERITRRMADGIAWIGFDRPEKKNAFTAAMYAELVDALLAADSDRSCRVIALHGSETCFTAGNDLQDFLKNPPNDPSSATVRFLKAIHHVSKPLVAAVAGPVVGIGTTLLLHCDLVWADSTARFQLPFVNLGLCPEAGSSYLLPRMIGHVRAAEALLLGEPFTSAQALEWGLINAIVADGQVLGEAEVRARSLAAKPAASLVLTKSLLKRATAPIVEQTIDLEIAHFAERLKSPEAKEALLAFFDRRPPDFSQFH